MKVNYKTKLKIFLKLKFPGIYYYLSILKYYRAIFYIRMLSYFYRKNNFAHIVKVSGNSHNQTDVMINQLIPEFHEVKTILAIKNLTRINIIISKLDANIADSLLNVLRFLGELTNDYKISLRIVGIKDDCVYKSVFNAVSVNRPYIIEYFALSRISSYKFELSKKDVFIAMDVEAVQFVKRINLQNVIFVFCVDERKLIFYSNHDIHHLAPSFGYDVISKEMICKIVEAKF